MAKLTFAAMSGTLATIAILLTSADAQGQIPPVKTYQPKATEQSRTAQVIDQQQKSAPSRFDLGKYPISDRTAQHWQESLWAIGVLGKDESYAQQALETMLAMTTASNLSNAQMGVVDTAIQVSHQLYTLKPEVYSNLKPHFLRTINESNDPQWVAISLSALSKSVSNLSPKAIDKTELNKLIRKVQKRFPKWQQDLHLKTTLQNIDADFAIANSSQTPDLQELLQWQIAPQQSHLYVFCRPNRDLMCLTILKDRDGKFVKQGKQLWSVPLLLQSLHNLDWNSTNGRTPQGIYRMEGISRQPDDEFFHAYGQFSLVNLFLPFEDGVTAFLPKQKGKFTGDLASYQALLPPTWRDYAPMQQAYWAGKMGRSLFRIHGSGAALDFFSSKASLVHNQNADWNPTLGCLSALEIYGEDGNLLKSDMPKILDVLSRVGRGKIEGYVIVVDLPNSSGQPVTMAELSQYLKSKD
ncbi:hypothetical protein [Pseudanabaena mucicola]|uniref:Uncharacterized protein n=1 Tax=Pseudanabaena mucicola FACHB-723 TaxID=2692860 RepID=A0ABR8A1D1_9CYAN|nr:hypothetical protein [Pseudanabaena mucicola]MBD2189555.1 hypothetical protein [Pseudanabaena mucicola FACHB-723]